MRAAILLLTLPLALSACRQPRDVTADDIASRADELTEKADAAVDRQIEEMGPVELWTPNQAG